MEAKCIKFYEFGSPQNVLQVEHKNILPPLNKEVLVRMTMRPINPSDLIPVKGSYSHRTSLPAIPGYEGVGIVEDVGSYVSQEFVGKRVLPLRGEGTWQEFVRTSAELTVPIPNSIDDDIAAQLYINPITAWIICTEVLKLGPGDVLLVNACGSAVGRILTQFSKIIGFRLIAVARNNKYTKELLELGASCVVNTSDTALYNTVRELTNGRGASAAVDSIGGSEGSELAFCVRPNGILLTIGLLSGVPINWKQISRGTKVNVKMFHLRYWNQQVSAQTWQKIFNRLITLINDQKLRLMRPDSSYNLSEIKQAVLASEFSQRNDGKVFLTS